MVSNEITDRWWVLDYLFDRFRWYRRRCGGHWEQWYIDVVHADIWHNRRKCHREIGRPPCAFGTPVCEDYPA